MNWRKLSTAILAAGVGGYIFHEQILKKYSPISCVPAKYYIGIDLGGTNAKAGVVDSNGTVISTATKELRSLSENSVLEDLVSCTTEALANSKLKYRDIKAIGIGSPGLLDYEVLFLLDLERDS